MALRCLLWLSMGGDNVPGCDHVPRNPWGPVCCAPRAPDGWNRGAMAPARAVLLGSTEPALPTGPKPSHPYTLRKSPWLKGSVGGRGFFTQRGEWRVRVTVR